MTSTRPPSIGPGTRARSSAAAAHCEQLAPLKSSRNAASLVAITVACVACDPQLVRTPTNCDQLNNLDRELHPGHYCTLSSGSPPRGSTSTLHSRRPIISYRTKSSDTSGPYIHGPDSGSSFARCVLRIRPSHWRPRMPALPLALARSSRSTAGRGQLQLLGALR